MFPMRNSVSTKPGAEHMKTTTSSDGRGRRPRRMVRLAALGASLLAGSSGVSRAAELPTGPAILQQMRSFSTRGSVLYIAAHPDDENTQAITYLARGRGYRTAYLSLTRGDGGQNLLGPQFPEQLGELTPWQPKRILHNVGMPGGGADAAGGERAGAVQIEVDGNDPVLGESFASIAARSRAMHKTQGFDMGEPPGGWRRTELFLTLGG